MLDFEGVRAWNENIAKPGYFVAHLCGAFPGQKMTVVTEGGAMPRRTIPGYPLSSVTTGSDKAHPLGYSAGYIERNPSWKLRIWPRRYELVLGGHCEFKPDQSVALTNGEGTVPEDLGVLRRLETKASAFCDQPIDRLRKHGRDLAIRHHLFSGVDLGHFGSIASNVCVTESPFCRKLGEAQSRRARPLLEVAHGFFSCNWESLGWNSEGVTAPSILVLTGHAGVGKTAALKLLAREWQKVHGEVLPLYTHMTELLAASPLDDHLSSLLEAHVKNFGFEKFDNFVNPDEPCKSVVLLIDSIDEAALSDRHSRLALMSMIRGFCDNPVYDLNVSEGCLRGFKTWQHKLKGIVIAARDQLSYAERRALGDATVVKLQDFDSDDVAKWLSIFYENATMDGKPIPSLSRLTKTAIFGQPFAPLAPVVTTPLYLYLLAATYSVSRQAASLAIEKPQYYVTPNAARFSIVSSFVNAATKGQFFHCKAFNPEVTHEGVKDVPKKVPLTKVLQRLGAQAGSSDAREINFGYLDKIADHDASDVLYWAIGSLPLERVRDDNSHVWRFPHLSLLDYLLADRLVDRFKGFEYVGGQSYLEASPEAPGRWWADQSHEFRQITIEAGETRISDRAFEFLEERLKRESGAFVTQIAEVARRWSTLNAVIVRVLPERSVNGFPENCHVTRRRDDLGLHIGRLALPLLGCCKRVLGETFQVGGQLEAEGAPRQQLRRFLRLSSFVVDGEFVSQVDVDRLRLRALHSHDASIEGVDMQEIVMEGGSLTNCQLRHANLLGANLKGVKIDEETVLDECNLVGAILEDAELHRGLAFRGVNLYQARFGGAKFVGCAKSGSENWVEFSYCGLIDAHLEDVDFPGVSFLWCTLMSAHMERAQFPGAKFEQCILNAANLCGAKLEGAIIKNCVWIGVSLDDKTTVKGAKFIDVVGLTADDFRLLKGASFEFPTVPDPRIK